MSDELTRPSRRFQIIRELPDQPGKRIPVGQGVLFWDGAIAVRCSETLNSRTYIDSDLFASRTDLDDAMPPGYSVRFLDNPP